MSGNPSRKSPDARRLNAVRGAASAPSAIDEGAALLHHLLALEAAPSARGRYAAYVDGLEALARTVRASPQSPVLGALHGLLMTSLTRFLAGPESAERAGFVTEKALDPQEVARWFDVLARDARARAAESVEPDDMRLNMLSFVAVRIIWRYQDAQRARRRASAPAPNGVAPCTTPAPAARLIARLTIERLLQGATARERQVLELLYEEHTPTEIARMTGISRREVGRCLERLRSRLMNAGGDRLVRRAK